MQTASRHRDTSSIPLGQRRGVSDLARFALDLTWAINRAESETTARPGAYPSPPMSGSPPLPNKSHQEAGDRSQAQGSYQTTNLQDVYRGSSTAPSPSDIRGQSSVSSLPVRSYPPEPPERMAYSYPPLPPDEAMRRPVSYPPQNTSSLQQQPPYMPIAGPSTGPAPGYSAPGQSSQENQPYTSPKSQRKTKGHVASACVPCKRAHLR
jgi:hypothetical protein